MKITKEQSSVLYRTCLESLPITGVFTHSKKLREKVLKNMKRDSFFQASIPKDILILENRAKLKK